MTIDRITFVDIETVPQNDPDKMFKGVNYDISSVKGEGGLFIKRFMKDILSMTEDGLIGVEESLYNNYYKHGSLSAEFGKIVSISIGKMNKDSFRIKTISGRDELKILVEASDIFNKVGCLCGHNSKEFDFPYLMRRMIVNKLPIPSVLDSYGKKPWEMNLEDTMSMWGGSAFNYRVSLELLCGVLGIPSPKKVIEGTSVSKIYYDSFLPEEGVLPFVKEEEALKLIGQYNAGDVLATANCYSVMRGLPLIENVEYV